MSDSQRAKQVEQFILISQMYGGVSVGSIESAYDHELELNPKGKISQASDFAIYHKEIIQSVFEMNLINEIHEPNITLEDSKAKLSCLRGQRIPQVTPSPLMESIRQAKEAIRKYIGIKL